jgi:hypothetical protein
MADRGRIVQEGLDIAAASVAVGALAEILPPIAAALAILWTLIRIGEWARVAIFKKPPRKID